GADSTTHMIASASFILAAIGRFCHRPGRGVQKPPFRAAHVKGPSRNSAVGPLSIKGPSRTLVSRPPRGPSDATIPAAAIWSPGSGRSKRRTRRSQPSVSLAPEDSPLTLVPSHRSLRAAGLVLALAAPIVAATALPAAAAGES